ncbi:MULTISPECIES: hypothetical protein [Pseudomonas]|nr:MULTISPECIES: hypothetical protein [Pseudomonas]MDG6400123.1 hypothetical protein [Pseudomonas quasicaspiana]MDU8361507.1 hypothetical protein [Pseudomonas syringae group sp. J309-1]
MPALIALSVSSTFSAQAPLAWVGGAMWLQLLQEHARELPV